MIISASRRTDIPNYYSEWFLHRIKEGFVCVRNPYHGFQVSKIDLSPEVVDCIVFWTKNPEEMILKLSQLKEYTYYFQFTLTGYGKDIEAGVPHKRERMISIFQKLSESIGKERVIWRYDPIIFTDKYTEEYHINAFNEIADKLKDYTSKVIVGFLKMYEKTRRNMVSVKIEKKTLNQQQEFASRISKIASEHRIEIEACAGELDLTSCGIKRGSCIDHNLIEQLLKCSINVDKDKNQRKECGCVESIDIGAYNSCLNKCLYCYGNESIEYVKQVVNQYEVNSPLLCSQLKNEDQVKTKLMKSIRDNQYRLF